MKAEESVYEVENQVRRASYWKEIIAHQEASGLNRVDYCRKHEINYDGFGYWFRKLKDSTKKSLIAVKLKAEIPPQEKSKLLSTLIFKNGNCLEVYDKEALLVVLGKL